MSSTIKFLKNLTLGFMAAGVIFIASPVLAQSPQSPNSPAGASQSYNWAGYVATGNNFTSVSGTWVVPTVTNSNNESADATWVGIGGVNSNDLIQAGTLRQNQGYSAWFELLPNSIQSVNLNVNAGDTIQVQINEVNTNQWFISISDLTSGQNYQNTVNYASSLSSAEWIEEMPTSNLGLVPLDNFGSVTFSNASVVENGQTLTLAQTGAITMTMLNAQGQTLASPSALTADGGGFTITRSTAVSTSNVGQTQTYGHRGFSRVGVGIQGFSGFTKHNNRSENFNRFSFSRSSFSRISFRF